MSKTDFEILCKEVSNTLDMNRVIGGGGEDNATE